MVKTYIRFSSNIKIHEDFKSASKSDLGSGAGFPGMVLAIFYVK